MVELRSLKEVFGRHEHFYVLNDRIVLPGDMTGRTLFIRHAERDFGVIVNLWEAWSILQKERPNVIVSTGAGPAVPFGLVAKLLRIPVLFIECGSQVTRPSLTGWLMYRLADRFFYQWPSLARCYPKGTCIGLLI